MNFDFDQKVWEFWEEIENIFDDELKASLKEMESGGPDSGKGIVLECLQRLGEIGYLDLGLKEARNSSILVSAQEILAIQDASLFLSIEVSTRIFGRLISKYGGDQSKSEILEGLKKGRIIGTVAQSEKGTNLEGHPIETVGRHDGEGFRVSGRKDAVINAFIADWIAVTGRVGDDPAFFLVQRDDQGLTVGPGISKLGYNNVSTSSLVLNNCFVPSDHVIGPFDNDRTLKEVRLWEDQVLTAAALGLMKQSLDEAKDFAKKHESGGKPVIAYQEVGFKLAEMFTLYQTSQLLAYRSAWMDETGDRGAGVVANCAKVFCGESAEKIASEALQILGIKGFTSNNPAEEGFRNAKYLQIAGTSTEISRMKIADGVLTSEGIH
ncbi:acyl-CoA dehydrogenase family protein [Thermodesulfobacteriota bacterium]